MSWTRRALLPVAIAQCAAPFLHALAPGGRPIGSDTETAMLRAPEDPPGAFFAIWALIFAFYLAFAIFALVRDEPLTRRLAPPLLAAGGLGTAWMLGEQLGAPLIWQAPVLFAMAAASWWGAWRFDHMRGLGGSAPKFIADATTGLLAGWLSLASAITALALVRAMFGIAATDSVWPMLLMGLGLASLAALAAGHWVTRSPWFTAALLWGFFGIALNNWTLTGLHVPAVAAATVWLALFWHRFAEPPHGAMRPA